MSDLFRVEAGKDTLVDSEGVGGSVGSVYETDYVLSEGIDVIASFVGGMDSFELPEGTSDILVAEGGEAPTDLPAEFANDWNDETSLTVSFDLNGESHTTDVID